MRAFPLLRLSSLLLLTGCATRAGVERAIAKDMRVVPPHTVMLSQMMRELSAQPGFTEQLLGYIHQGQKNGAFLTPSLFDTLRKLILGKEWTGLDRFPGWTIHRVTQTVDVGTSLLKVDDETAAASFLKTRSGTSRSLSKSCDRRNPQNVVWHNLTLVKAAFQA